MTEVFPTGDITIVKETVGANGPFDFSSTGGGGLPANFSITTEGFDPDTDPPTLVGTGSITFPGVLTGAKTVTEDLPNGWEFKNLECVEVGIGEGVADNGSTPSTPDPNTKTANIDLDSAEKITCTFVNRAFGKLTVTKVVDNTGGGTKSVSDFPLFVDDDSVVTEVTSGYASNLTPGTYIVSETPDPDYDATFSGACESSTVIEVKVGDDLTCTITNTFQPNPGLAVDKTASVASVDAPGAVTYGYAVTNTDNISLTGVTLSDDNTDAAPTFVDGDTDGDTELDLTETWTYTATHTVTQAEIDLGADIVNLATANSNEVGPATDTETVEVDQNPALSIVKTASPATYSAVGEVISYSYLVTNTGNVTISGPIVVTDDNVDAPATCAAGDLAPGASLTCTASRTITQFDLDAGSVTNVASASGTDPNDAPVTSPPERRPGDLAARTTPR